MLTVTDVLYGICFPLVASGIFTLVFSRLLINDAAMASRRSNWQGLLAGGVAIAVLAGFWLGVRTLNLIPLRPKAYWTYLPSAALVAIPLSILNASLRWNVLARWIVAWLVLLGVGYVLIPVRDSATGSPWNFIAVWAAATSLGAMRLEYIHERLPGSTLPAIMAASMLGVAILSQLNHAARLTLASLVAASSLCGVAIGGRLLKRNTSLPGVATTYVVLSATLLLVGHYMATGVDPTGGLPGVSYLMVAGAPLTSIWLVRHQAGPLSRKQIVAAVLTSATVCLGGILLAFLKDRAYFSRT